MHNPSQKITLPRSHWPPQMQLGHSKSYSEQRAYLLQIIKSSIQEKVSMQASVQVGMEVYMVSNPSFRTREYKIKGTSNPDCDQPHKPRNKPSGFQNSIFSQFKFIWDSFKVRILDLSLFSLFYSWCQQSLISEYTLVEGYFRHSNSSWGADHQEGGLITCTQQQINKPDIIFQE